MAEPTNGSFRLLLDEQKKSNEQLATISQTLINDGSAKEIIKQSLPEVLNERQLAGRRDKFFKKTGMTETDDLVEKLIDRITDLVEVGKDTNEKVTKQTDGMSILLTETSSSVKMDAMNEKQKIDAEEKRLKLVKQEREKQGKNVKADIDYKIDI